MGLVLLLLVALQGAAAQPPDLVAQASSDRLPSFTEVLDARFGQASDMRFAAFKAWAAQWSDAERARWAKTVPPSERADIGCAVADSRGVARAMVAAAEAPDRDQARRMWDEADRVAALAPTLEREDLAQARMAARPTAIGRALALRVATDQAWRNALFDREHGEKTSGMLFARLSGRMCHIDRENLAYLKTVIARARWPTMSRDGADAAHDAWLLAQHADVDPAFQEQVLALMEPLVARHEASGKDYALLFDCVALARHRPQRFGTQFGDGDGCLAVERVEDHPGLDARRKSVGLETLAENAKHISAAYHQPICADIFAVVER